MPKGAARVLGYLMICQPESQSADAIAKALKMSAGAVSGAVNALSDLNLLHHSTNPGSRRIYYQIDSTFADRVLQMRLAQVRNALGVINDGLALSGADWRLNGLRILYDDYRQYLASKLISSFRNDP